MSTFYWHDYETWGVDPSRHRPSQFAGLRTDAALNEIGKPLVIYCQPPDDDLPDPEACLITGITPQQAAQQGLREAEFVAAIHRELATPGTCGVGYNSIRFDDEITRYSLYRNFYDPYAREWQNGGSRWDLIDVVRACHALRPEGIEWPRREDGSPSFRLEELSRANGLEHTRAHDALSDVYATLAMARLIRARQPRLFDYLLALRSKHKVAELVDVRQRKPVLHVSGLFPSSRGCTGLVMPLAVHPRNRNGIICFDLSGDPQPLLDLDAEALRRRVFTSQAELGDELSRVALTVIYLNRCPVVATPKLLDAATAQRLQLDTEVCQRHYQQLQQAFGQPSIATALTVKLAAVYSESFLERGDGADQDVDAALYGSFLPDADRDLLAAVHQTAPEQLGRGFPFRDERLPELLFRYRARNWLETLDAEERLQWQGDCRQRIEQHWGAGGKDYLQRLAALEPTGDLALLAELRAWFEQRRAVLGF